MSASPPPADPATQIQWLVDRAQISDLLVEFARALDDRDGAAYAALYTEDGVLEFPGLSIKGREELRAGVERGLGGYAAVWHLSANHAIEIDGDVARVRSYVIGVHRHGDDLGHHADLGGWYDTTLGRIGGGWRFTSVRAHGVWASGAGPLPHG